MRKVSTLILTCLILMATRNIAENQPVEVTGIVTLEWEANSEVDLAGYRLYQSKEHGVYPLTPIVDIPLPIEGTPTHKVESLLEDERYFWVVTAYDSTGNESEYSNEVTTIIKIPPKPPTKLRVTVEIIFPVVRE